ncbi:MAG TPA: CPBP family intramembrane glutamic endopeptidase [Bryobacteraceae bacterium]|nr:CPBP family intramembrane glutamic endopeptidase [Bryobacteraceae bacterium]
MQSFLIVLFLVIVLSLFSPALQGALRGFFIGRPAAVFAVPCALTALFACVLAESGGWSTAFVLLVAVYTFVPTALAYARKPRLDFAAILLLWMPIEFATGRQLIPRAVWGLANIAARGTALTLALALFLLFRNLPLMKYNLPRKWTDLLYPAIGLAALTPVLAALGVWLGYMGPFVGFGGFHPGGFGLLWLRTALGVALPEELLFRALIQNWLMLRFGFTVRTLAVAALIFGASHLDNPPGPLPNWRYMILATIAGFVFGGVFWKSSSIWSSAGLHALVNCTRHVFFG